MTPEEEQRLLDNTLVGTMRRLHAAVKEFAAELRVQWWGVEQWLLTRVFRLSFCHSCSGYFRMAGMAEFDQCEACYARFHVLSGE